jgi:carbohydrate kinase (thermoresistant glucokinase family)
LANRNRLFGLQQPLFKDMPDSEPRAVILMGVAGSGKSTVGVSLAKRLGCPFLDADAFHPSANVEKMKHGIPLDDEDRMPWKGRRTLLSWTLAVLSKTWLNKSSAH